MSITIVMRVTLVGGLDDNFLKRVYPVSALITGLAFLFTFMVFGYELAIGVLVGGAFAIINTMLLGNVIRATIKPGPRNPVEIYVTLFIKFPVAIGLLILSLWLRLIDPIGFLIGFTVFPVALLIALAINFYSSGNAGVPRGEDSR